MKWIHADQIAMRVQSRNWQEAVRQSGELLVAAGLADPGYIDAMIQTTQELGPYCVLAPGIAMPHARPDETVKQSGFSAITLKHPVEFGNPDNDPVYLVIAFCTLDHDAHIKALSMMAESVSRPDFLEMVKKAQDAEELEAILNATEQG